MGIAFGLKSQTFEVTLKYRVKRLVCVRSNFTNSALKKRNSGLFKNNSNLLKNCLGIDFGFKNLYSNCISAYHVEVSVFFSFAVKRKDTRDHFMGGFLRFVNGQTKNSRVKFF